MNKKVHIVHIVQLCSYDKVNASMSPISRVKKQKMTAPYTTPSPPLPPKEPLSWILTLHTLCSFGNLNRTKYYVLFSCPFFFVQSYVCGFTHAASCSCVHSFSLLWRILCMMLPPRRPPASRHSTDDGYLFPVWIVIFMPSAYGSSG